MSRKAQEEFLREDQRSFEAAATAMARDSNIRTLLRRLYSACGMADNPFDVEGLTMAFKAGKMAVGQEFFGLLNEIDPNLLPTLMQEMNHERATRDAIIAADRGYD